MTDSRKAWELFSDDPEAFDLVLSDMTMPQLTGAELAQRILARRPDIPAIISTGYSEQIDERKAKERGIRAFVMKPIVMHEMAETIRAVLEGGKD